jgi:CTP synthase
MKLINAESLESSSIEKYIDKDVSGILIPGGFGKRGIEGKIKAVNFARVNKIPFLGLCLGMQCAVIEFARNVCGLNYAHSTEFEESTPEPVIDLMESQKSVLQKGGSMRLGAYPCIIKKDSLAYKAYASTEISERHRHRFEFNNRYRGIFERKGMIFSGICPRGDLVEIIELDQKLHPWFVGVQFHPEFKSKPLSTHPLFRDFIKASIDYSYCKSKKGVI